MSGRNGQITPCSVCGAERTLMEAARGSICGQPACRHASLHRKRTAEKQVFEAACAEITTRTGTRTDVTARVPYLDRAVVDTPEKTKRAFRMSLRKEIRAAVAETAKGDAPAAPENSKPSPLTLDASCIACRGRCCRLGRDHAFLDMENMQTLLAQRPEDSPATVYRDYVRRIPDQSMDQACVLQGKHGCSLPSHMRSSVCHRFECDERLALKEALNGDQDASVLVIAMDGEDIKAAVVARPEEELEWLEV